MKKIETDRLILRELNRDDLNDILEYLPTEDYWQYQMTDIHSMDSAQAKEHFLNMMLKHNIVGIELKSNHKIIGHLSYYQKGPKTYEMGCALNPEFQHFGYAVESCKAFMDILMSDGCDRIYFRIHPKNISSRKMAERLDMKCEQVLYKGAIVYYLIKN